MPTVNLYTYNATVKEIIDGDTIVIVADLGFKVFKELKVRLARINSPEIATPEGKAAKAFLEQNLPIGSQVILISKSYDKYGRSIGEIICNNININDLILNNNYAVKY